MKQDHIKIVGAKTNNLKNINLEIPRNKLIVITGLSGSGKSSLAFDTIYAEGQRRYVESLSAYARQFVGLMTKPDIESISGLSPAISIDQRSVSNNPRSTVGTSTNIYDYLRLLYAKCGEPYCPYCDLKLKKNTEKRVETKIVSGRKIKSQKVVNFYTCRKCDYSRQSLESKDFSFNSGNGACLTCSGLGFRLEIDPILVFNKNLSILEGAIKVISYTQIKQGDLFKSLEEIARKNNFSLNTAIKDLDKKQVNALLYGDKNFSGLLSFLEKRYQETQSNFVKSETEKIMHKTLCATCLGARLKPESLAVKIESLNIFEISQLSIDKLSALMKSWLDNLDKFKKQAVILEPIAKEIYQNLKVLEDVGLSYLSLSRNTNTLSGGEDQRIRLASQVGANLTGVLYVLDEPTVGLHPRDTEKLIDTIKSLRDKQNTVIVVEHDESMMMAADYLIDIGPGAGDLGGELLFIGEPKKINQCPDSLTGDYLSKRKQIVRPKKTKPKQDRFIKIIGATAHNLKNIDVKIPLGNLISITGVSGSGKSTLMNDILAKYLTKKFYRAKNTPGEHKMILGLEYINKVIDIDQSPIGKTPRSNPATYTGLFTHIRDLFAKTAEAKLKRLNAGHFSFNVNGGRCDHCLGDGAIKIEMQFLSDVFITCDVCDGQRFKKDILAIKYKGKNIYEVLEMTVSEASEFFIDTPALRQKLDTLNKVGLSYIKLGQSATTFSGGEAQRIKLATELSRRSTGKTLYILDEPTTGLHFADIDRLLKVLHLLVEQGNTVLVIEHNLEIIKASDWIIDLGPEGGEKGGELVAEGSPAELIKNKKSHTAKYLKQVL